MKIVTNEQYTPEWWAARRGMPTASNAARVFTSQGKPSAQQSAYIADLIAERYDPMYGQADDYQTAAMRNGHIMEPTVRAYYEFHTGETVQQVGLVTTEDGRFGCSPDGLIGEDGGIEIKSPKHSTQVKYLLRGGVPPEYLPQVHWSLIVTGRQWWDFLSYADGLPKLLVRVEPDEYTVALRQEMERFYEKYQAAMNHIQSLDSQSLTTDAGDEDAEIAKLFSLR